MLRGKILKVRQQYLREMEERNYEGTYVQCPTVPTGHLYVNGGLIEYAYVWGLSNIWLFGLMELIKWYHLV